MNAGNYRKGCCELCVVGFFFWIRDKDMTGSQQITGLRFGGEGLVRVECSWSRG